jgi:hypothetical protein
MAELNNQSYIFHPDANQTPSPKTINCFTMLGDHDFIDDQNRPRAKTENSHVVAKTIKNGNGPERFYIKVGPNGHIYNPIGMFSEGNNNKFLAKIGKKEWEFKEVNQYIFDLYTNFLTTKNIAWINNAEREMI